MPEAPSWKELDEVRIKALKVKCSSRSGIYCNISKKLCNPPQDCFKLECITLMKKGV